MGLALKKPSRNCARVDFPLPYIYEMRACPRISGYAIENNWIHWSLHVALDEVLKKCLKEEGIQEDNQPLYIDTGTLRIHQMSLVYLI